MNQKTILNDKLPIHGYANLNKQRKEGFLCDIQLVVEGKRFPAHKAVMAASSDYFATMFRTNMKEKYAETVAIKEITHETVAEILEYLYSGKIELSSINVSHVLQTASLWQLSNLLNIVDKFLLENINPKNCIWLKQTSVLFGLNSLQQKVEECICKNFDKICQLEDFVELSVVELQKYFQSEEIKIKSEDILFTALVTWTKHDFENRKEKFLTLFSLIRLQLVLVDFLSNTIRKHELVLRYQEILSMMQCIFIFSLKCLKNREVEEQSMENHHPLTTAVADIPNEDCSICMTSLLDESGFDNAESKNFCHVVELKKCQHRFHALCFKAAFDNSSDKICPYCKNNYGTKKGIQPQGHMTHRIVCGRLPGFFCRTISITYYIQSGIQGNEHPNPGQIYNAVGFPRQAFLPDNKEGRKILKLLKVAWDRRLIFTIGRSVTIGSDNCVTWNEIHHKTSMHRGGSHSYPDPGYFTNVIEELKAQGVTEADISTVPCAQIFCNVVN